jgi:D-tyrosyl-tRNA(Tyr) deacylase
MRVILQRVSAARVEVKGSVAGEVSHGLVVLIGIRKGDTNADADYLADKVSSLRLFADDAGKMNLSLLDVGGSALLISQFTLYADTTKGRRPSFDEAATPAEAEPIYDYFVQRVKRNGIQVATGVFRAEMRVSLVNEGPVTFILDSIRE